MGNIVLVLFGIYIIMSTIGGFRKGFLKSLFMIATWCLTLTIASGLVGDVKDPIADFYLMQTGKELAMPIAYAFAFVLVLVMLKIIFGLIGHLLNVVSDAPVFGTFNHLLGGIFGFMKGLLVVSILLFVIYLMPYVGFGNIHDALLKGSDLLTELVNENVFIFFAKNLLTK